MVALSGILDLNVISVKLSLYSAGTKRLKGLSSLLVYTILHYYSLYYLLYYSLLCSLHLYSVSQKITPPLRILSIFAKRLGIFN